MIVHIDVTQQDIDQGQRCRSRLCPVALAGQRAMQRKDVNVGQNVFYTDDMNMPMVDLPSVVRDNIYAYDMGNKVEPFSFDLEFPDVLP